MKKYKEKTVKSCKHEWRQADSWATERDIRTLTVVFACYKCATLKRVTV